MRDKTKWAAPDKKGRCEKCGRSGVLNMFQGKKVCDSCLNPDNLEEELEEKRKSFYQSNQCAASSSVYGIR